MEPPAAPCQTHIKLTCFEAPSRFYIISHVKRKFSNENQLKRVLHNGRGMWGGGCGCCCCLFNELTARRIVAVVACNKLFQLTKLNLHSCSFTANNNCTYWMHFAERDMTLTDRKWNEEPATVQKVTPPAAHTPRVSWRKRNPRYSGGKWKWQTCCMRKMLRKTHSWHGNL